MALFSQRNGLKHVKTAVQFDGVDEELRVALWNVLSSEYWDKVNLAPYGMLYAFSDPPMARLCRSIWADYFKSPTDTISEKWSDTYGRIRTYFFNCAWYEVYDFVEFVSTAYTDIGSNARFQEKCNMVLEREVSAYRFVSGRISQITSPEEIRAIEETIELSDNFGPVSTHVSRALGLLVDRKNPDYRNSIKESISAVEACCKLITGDPKTDLHRALKELGKRINLHPALEGAFVKMYAFTSDEGGIRHALLDESDLAFEDAKFMLVSCCGFVNYLRAKAVKGGIEF